VCSPAGRRRASRNSTTTGGVEPYLPGHSTVGVSAESWTSGERVPPHRRRVALVHAAHVAFRRPVRRSHRQDGGCGEEAADGGQAWGRPPLLRPQGAAPPPWPPVARGVTTPRQKGSRPRRCPAGVEKEKVTGDRRPHRAAQGWNSTIWGASERHEGSVAAHLGVRERRERHRSCDGHKMASVRLSRLIKA